MKLVCKHETADCKIVPGEKWQRGVCAVCWKWANSPAWKEHYENLKPPARQPKGLGDTVEQAIQKAVKNIPNAKLRAAIEKWVGSCTSCAARKEKLNKLGRWTKRILKE